LLFSSVTCLEDYKRWDPFVLGAQPWDTSPLSLCQHNKILLLAKLPQCLISQLQIPAIFLEGSSRIMEIVICHPPDYWEKWSHWAPMDILIQRRDSSSLRVRVKASDAQQNPVRCRNQQGEGTSASGGRRRD
jgi:hypothetical protein